MLLMKPYELWGFNENIIICNSDAKSRVEFHAFNIFIIKLHGIAGFMLSIKCYVLVEGDGHAGNPKLKIWSIYIFFIPLVVNCVRLHAFHVPALVYFVWMLPWHVRPKTH